MLHDLRIAVRSLAAARRLAIVAVATLGVGIGAATATFSVVAALLIRPLPLADADRIVAGIALREGFDPFGTSLLEYEAYRDSTQVFAASGVATQQFVTISSSGDAEPERVHAAVVTSGFLDALDVAPIAGRRLAAADANPAAVAVALIGYDVWQQRFGGARSAVGSTLTIDRRAYTIVGVMPPGFDAPSGASMWLPDQRQFGSLPLAQRIATAQAMFARLAPGVTLDAANAAVIAIARRLETDYPQYRRGWTYRLVPLRQYFIGDLSGRTRLAALTLSAAVACLLLICCANVANLLLMRGVRRQREMAVRRAMGASDGRLVRQLLAESVILAAGGAVVGVLIAFWAAPLLAALNPIRADSLSSVLNAFNPDGRVLAFAILASLVTCVVTGVMPAIRIVRAGDVASTLRAGDRRTASGRTAGLTAFVVAEMAIAAVLVVNGSLVVQSLARLQHVDLGFDPERLLTMELSPDREAYRSEADVRRYVERLVDTARRIPGVSDAAIATNTPLQDLSFDSVFTVEGRPPLHDADVPIAAHRLVTPGYLQTLGVRLVRGRFLDERDREGAPLAVVVTEELARQAWPNEDPIGRRIRRGRVDDLRFPWLTVVGVVGDVKEDRYNFRINRPAWYLPLRQHELTGTLNLVVRVSGDVSAAAPAVRAAIRGVDPRQAVSPVGSMTTQLRSVWVTERFAAALMTAFAAVGVLLAASGLAVVIAYGVAQRTPEIGLRIALGAAGTDVVRLLMRQGIIVTAAGVVIGSAAARAFAAVLASALYGVTPNDPATFAAVAVALSAIGLTACYLPARRAIRVDPLIALKAE